MRISVLCVVSIVGVLAGVRTATAQGTGNSTITGIVKDTSGGVLPGVTVEAASPVLIEGVRSAVTDDRGEYRILELRPGSYSVTFTLTGFNALKRDNIELPSSFTASINVELAVGAMQETVVVTGGAPLIDTQNMTQQRVISKDVLDAVPTARSALGIAALMPSVVEPPNAQDVGGSKGERSVRITVHGSKTIDARQLQDGMRYNALTPGIGPPFNTTSLEGTGRGYYINPLAAQEIVIDVGTMGSAEYEYGGAQVNTIRKDGGNLFAGSFFTGWTGHQLQADNLTSDLRALGLTSVNTVREVYDVNGALGGPLLRNKVWFFASGRRWGTQTSAANLYADANISRAIGSPASTWVYAPALDNPIHPKETDKAAGVRLTYQAPAAHKFAFSYDAQKNFQDQLTGQLETGTIKNEANNGYCQRQDLTQLTWNRPSSRLLLEAGVTVSRFNFGSFGHDLFLSDFAGCGGGLPDNVSINDTTLGYTYNGSGARTLSKSHQTNGRFSTSYLAGDHQIKAGLFWMWGLGGGHRTYTSRTPAQGAGLPVAYTFNNGTPTSLTQYAAPLLTIDQLNPDLGLFVQDQWRYKRVTLNGGVRFDWVHESVPAISIEAGPLVGARSFAAVDNVPNWKDISPRFGIAWDLLGDGKTAVKAGINRYVQSATTGIANQFDPVNASVNSVTRSWNDANGNFQPDCVLTSLVTSGECGPVSNANFGSLSPSLSPDPTWINGWGKRPYNWQLAVSVDRQIGGSTRVTAGFYRTWYGNFMALDNTLVTPADYSQYCVTGPSDARLPAEVSGQQICGLYDINADKFGRVNNIATLASKFGKQTEIYQGADASFTTRIWSKGTLAGGWNIGNALQTGTSAGGTSSSSTDICFVVDSPQQLYQCKVDVPHQQRFKLNGSYPLPYEFQVAAVFQSNPGPNYNANATYTTAQVAPSLGRPLSGAVRTVTVNLVTPFSQFGPRINQFDLRFSKILRLGGSRRLQANLDLYNVLNNSSVVNFNSTYGPLWLQPTQILDGRLFKFSAQIDF
jgi:hypothetical protein